MAAAAAAASVALTLSCMLAVPASASAARAARAPSWHVVYRQAGISVTGVVATSSKNAWAIGLADSRPTGILLHWNGRRWGRMTLPDAHRFLPMAIYPVSATDFWLAQYNSVAPTEMLHWKNGKWSTLTLPINADPLLVLGDHDIWVESQEDGPGTPCPILDKVRACVVTAHWNGSAWVNYPLHASGLLTAAASTPSDIWAVGDVDVSGNGTVFRTALFRWTGSSWRHIALTSTRMEFTPPILAYSPADLYVDEATPAHPRACAMHWNGHQWSPVYLAHSSGACGEFSTDYYRGLWVNGPGTSFGYAFAHWTGSRFIYAPVFVPVSPLTPGGGYAGGADVAAIPHSHDLWLFGNIAVCTPKCGATKATIALLS